MKGVKGRLLRGGCEGCEGEDVKDVKYVNWARGEGKVVKGRM